MSGRVLRSSSGISVVVVYVATPKQQIREMFYAIYLQMVLVTHESEISSKSHDKLFDILNNLLFHHSLVYVYSLTFPYLFHVDIV